MDINRCLRVDLSRLRNVVTAQDVSVSPNASAKHDDELRNHLDRQRNSHV
jgi:hypothetical protein